MELQALFDSVQLLAASAAQHLLSLFHVASAQLTCAACAAYEAGGMDPVTAGVAAAAAAGAGVAGGTNVGRNDFTASDRPFDYRYYQNLGRLPSREPASSLMRFTGALHEWLRDMQVEYIDVEGEKIHGPYDGSVPAASKA